MPKVAVAMSGGVDSSVTVLLLQQQGYEVVGLTMDIGIGNACRKAAEVADFFNIQHHVISLHEEFQHNVIDYFVREYQEGRTPNPCVMCNRDLKFGKLFAAAEALGCDYFATGHYVQLCGNGDRITLKKAVYLPKDQSYVLFYLPQEVLRKVMFPLGLYSKEEIRKIALDAGLPIAKDKESQDICFIPDGNYRDFLSDAGLKTKPGNFVDINGRILGRHKGLSYYTVGQRKGLGLALGYPAYVVALNKEKNEVVIGVAENLLQKSLLVRDCNFLLFDKLDKTISAEVKIRYKSPSATAIIMPHGSEVEVIFDEPQSAVTPGQAAVFYHDDMVIGGGIIK